MQDRYANRRAEFEARFALAVPVPGEMETHSSPSGQYVLQTSQYADVTGWGFSRGLVRRQDDEQLIADIKRNLRSFWHAWIIHQNGNEYLLCGEDYQGYTVLECQTGRMRAHFPEDGFEGAGFCWAAVRPSPNGQTLAVEGCVWACPYELVFVDFSEPMRSPLPELQRFPYLDTAGGWSNDFEFRFTAFDDDDEVPPSRPHLWKREAGLQHSPGL
jgi:hypothetical protein